MGRSGMRAVGAAVSSIILLAACSRAPATQPSTAAAPPAPSAAPTLPQTGPSPVPSVTATAEPTPSIDPLVPSLADFDHAHFTHPVTIDNEWLPLLAGRRWIFDGVLIEEGERTPHRITVTVTHLTKVIDGVPTAVVWIEDINEGELVEKEIAFYAEDDEGTVWFFGEHPEELEDGEVVDAPTWIAGLADAKPGVMMFADPDSHPGTYFQGLGPEVGWSDFSRLDAAGISDCVLTGCYTDVDRFAESSLDEEGIFQLKSYARGVGEIRVGWRGESDSVEELELKSTAVVRGAALAKFDDMALALEAHAYQISRDVYGKTEPMR